MAKFKFIVEVVRGKNPFWRILAGNGQVLAHSEVYSSDFKAIATAKNVSLNLSCCKFIITRG